MTVLQRLSYSKLSTYLNCGEAHRLTVEEGLPDFVGWYNIGGTAVHAMTEAEDLLRFGIGEKLRSFDHYFDAALAEQAELTPDVPTSEYISAGKKDEPENETWWRNAGPGLVATWRRWLDSSPWIIYVTPDGEPAIELEMDSVFDGVPSKAFIDRVLVQQSDPIGGVIAAVDIKNGKPPKSRLQLATYAEALRLRGINATHGGYFMTKGGVLSGFWDLTDMVGPKLHHEYSQAWTGIQAGYFPARPSGLCKNHCGVARFCAWGGQLTDTSYLPYEEKESK